MRTPLLCRLGVHRWETTDSKSRRGGRVYIHTWNRCTREGCPRYSQWRHMNTEQSRWES